MWPWHKYIVKCLIVCLEDTEVCIYYCKGWGGEGVSNPPCPFFVFCFSSSCFTHPALLLTHFLSETLKHLCLAPPKSHLLKFHILSASVHPEPAPLPPPSIPSRTSTPPRATAHPSPWRYSWTMRPSWPCTACSSTTSSWRTTRRTGSCSICWTCWSSTRYRSVRSTPRLLKQPSPILSLSVLTFCSWMNLRASLWGFSPSTPSQSAATSFSFKV